MLLELGDLLGLIWYGGLMDDLRFYVLFDSISVRSERWVSDFERSCAMEPCLWFRRFSLEQGSNLELLDP